MSKWVNNLSAVSFMKARPRKRTERAKRNRKLLYIFFLDLEKNIPMVLMASPGMAMDSMSRRKPAVATIQLIIVEPRFEPMITPSAFLKGIRPASTKPSVMRATTEED